MGNCLGGEMFQVEGTASAQNIKDCGWNRVSGGWNRKKEVKGPNQIDLWKPL